MKKAIACLAALLTAVAAQAQEAQQPRFLENANAIGNAIHGGNDLNATGLTQVLGEAELAELRRLAGCTPALRPGMTKNMVIMDWTCAQSEEPVPPDFIRYRTIKMRFTDEGGLFAMAVNPWESSFAPTEVALAADEMPSRRRTARQFADAIREGGDPSLGGLVPMTALQVNQLGALKGRTPEIQEPPTSREVRQIRAVMGPGVNIYRGPQNGIEMVFPMGGGPGDGDTLATVFFDDEDRPIGVHVEESTIRVAAITGPTR